MCRGTNHIPGYFRNSRAPRANSLSKTSLFCQLQMNKILTMANAEGENTKSKPRQNEDAQQTVTLSFVPEIERYERPKNREEYIRSYFESINGINKRIIAEERRIIAQNRNTWPTLPVEERDRLLNDQLISSNVRQKYNSNEVCLAKKEDHLTSPIDKPNTGKERAGTTSKVSALFYIVCLCIKCNKLVKVDEGTYFLIEKIG